MVDQQHPQTPLPGAGRTKKPRRASAQDNDVKKWHRPIVPQRPSAQNACHRRTTPFYLPIKKQKNNPVSACLAIIHISLD
ncbi:hypothetical protein [Allofranklinella schreckenbergeri]|uniref:hypothetical protein n=1 Tax=Allofranklinella schreckenbergeri TaxID=1076744 RepID=UPI001EED3C3B|nr:hypothetical protein [Allofranklinella schreckenbergeri]